MAPRTACVTRRRTPTPVPDAPSTSRSTPWTRAKLVVPLLASVLLCAACAGMRGEERPAAGGGVTTRGVLVMAHGGDAAWNESVEATVAPVRDHYPTEVAFGMARTSTMREAVRRLEEQGVGEIAVVRMFISGESFLEATEVILGLRDGPVPHAMPAGAGHAMEPPRRIESDAAFCPSRAGVAESSLVDGILADRVRALSTDPSEESVLLLAHGPGDEDENERWLANMTQRLARIRQLGAFRDVRCETLREDWPEARAAAERRIRAYVEQANEDGGRTLVVPFRIAGFGPYGEVLAGLDHVADGRGLCPHPNMTRWVLRTARGCFEEGSVTVP